MNQCYAISEAFVVVAGIYSAIKFSRRNQSLMAIACALFALAAAIGTIKYGFDLKSELSKAHSMATQFGGIFAIGLILSEFIYFGRSRFGFWQRVILAASFAFIGFFSSQIGAIIFIASLGLCTIILGYQTLKHSANPSGAIGFLTMLINVLLIRNSPILGPDISFIGFHLLVALWLALLPKTIENYNSLVFATSSI